MIYNKDLKDYEFNNIEEYFDYIIESIINGQRKQANDLVGELSKGQKKDFMDWAGFMSINDDPYVNEALKLVLNKL